MGSTWQVKSSAILVEGLNAYFAGFERSALHATYDSISEACRGLGLAKYNDNGSFSYLQSVWAVSRKFGVSNSDMETSVLDIGDSRNASVHNLTHNSDFRRRWPSVRPFAPLPLKLNPVLSHILSFLEAAGITLDRPLAQYKAHLTSPNEPLALAKRRKSFAAASATWQHHALFVLSEAIACHRKELWRSSVHGARDEIKKCLIELNSGRQGTKLGETDYEHQDLSVITVSILGVLGACQ